MKYKYKDIIVNVTRWQEENYITAYDLSKTLGFTRQTVLDKTRKLTSEYNYKGQKKYPNIVEKTMPSNKRVTNSDVGFGLGVLDVYSELYPNKFEHFDVSIGNNIEIKKQLEGNTICLCVNEEIIEMDDELCEELILQLRKAMRY